MATTKIVVSIESETLREVDRLVEDGRFSNRSGAVQIALADMLARRKRHQLIEELAKLDPRQERGLAEESFASKSSMPEC